MATEDTTDNNPVVAPPRRVVRRRQRPDRNRPYEILSVLLIYIIAVHYALKFASFFLPEATLSREEMLGVRGATGVMGFSLKALPSPRRKPLFKINHEQGRIASSCRSHSMNALYSLSNPEIAQEKGTIMNTENSQTPQSESETPTKPKRTRIPILSYKPTYVIVSKPTSMTMHHNGQTRWGRSKSPVLQNTIHKQLSRKPYLVHRLDHRTSGACIVGFDSKTAGNLHGRLRDGVKLYVALVRGDLRERFQCAAAASGDGLDMSRDSDGSVVGSYGNAPSIMTSEGGEQEDQSPNHDGNSTKSEYSGKISVTIPIKVRINEDEFENKEAQTDFYFLSSMPYDDDDDDTKTLLSNNNTYINKELSLLLCHPQTGRTHQIRKHVTKAFNSPIIGDSEHGDSRVSRYWRETTGLDRLGLHCWYLGLPPSPTDKDNGDVDAVGNDSIECMAPLTTDLTGALRHEMLQSLWEEATSVEPRLNMEPYDERGGSFGRNYRKSLQRDGKDDDDHGNL